MTSYLGLDAPVQGFTLAPRFFLRHLQRSNFGIPKSLKWRLILGRREARGASAVGSPHFLLTGHFPGFGMTFISCEQSAVFSYI